MYNRNNTKNNTKKKRIVINEGIKLVIDLKVQLIIYFLSIFIMKCNVLMVQKNTKIVVKFLYK